MITAGLSYIRKHSRWLACCHISTIWVSSKKNQKSNIGWPQQPLTEKMLKFNMIFYATVKTFLFSKHQNQVILVLKLLNSRTWITLKSSVVIFQALESLQPQWPLQPQQPQWPQWPQQPHFIKKFTRPHRWIIPNTQMTNTILFLCNGSSKIQFFTNIWYPFCPRLLRPADATF